jgi:hypothetical protein
MIDDYEDIFTDEPQEQISIDDITKDSSTGADGCQFYFIPDGKFSDKSLPLKVESAEEYKELVDSVFKLGVALKKTMHGGPGQFFPFFSLLKKDSEVVHGTMLPNDKNESYQSLLAYLNEENKEKIKAEDLSRILHMIEVKSHSCSKPTFEQCRCPTTKYKTQLLIQSHNLEHPDKSLTFAMDFTYTEDGVIFDENSIQVMPMERSINTGKWDDVKFDNPNDSPYN